MERLTIDIDIEVVEEFGNKTTVARVYYPNEGNKIKVVKGLNAVEFSTAIHHEIGHLFDWYLSGGKQSKDVEIREENADVIGDGLRWKESTENETKTD